MNYMKLGSKPDSFESDGDNIGYVATELANDLVVNVGDVKFYLHKSPLLPKSGRLQKLVATTGEESDQDDEINIPDIPGGPAAFEICAKFCYGMIVTINAHNVVAARCAAEYLEMYESVDKGNLVYKLEVFLNSSLLRNWKDSIIVLQNCREFHPLSEELKIAGRCLESIASKVAMDPARVECLTHIPGGNFLCLEASHRTGGSRISPRFMSISTNEQFQRSELTVEFPPRLWGDL